MEHKEVVTILDSKRSARLWCRSPEGRWRSADFICAAVTDDGRLVAESQASCPAVLIDMLLTLGGTIRMQHDQLGPEGRQVLRLVAMAFVASVFPEDLPALAAMAKDRELVERVAGYLKGVKPGA